MHVFRYQKAVLEYVAVLEQEQNWGIRIAGYLIETDKKFGDGRFALPWLPYLALSATLGSRLPHGSRELMHHIRVTSNKPLNACGIWKQFVPGHLETHLIHDIERETKQQQHVKTVSLRKADERSRVWDRQDNLQRACRSIRATTTPAIRSASSSLTRGNGRLR